PSGFLGTNLLNYLVLLQCDSIILAGTTTSGCVRATAVDAYSYNFRVAVVEDACSDRFEFSHAASLGFLHHHAFCSNPPPPSPCSGQKRRLVHRWPRRLLRDGRMSGGRQLQHRRVLPLDQPREQYHLSVGKFQCIVMDHGIVRIDLPEARKPLSDFLVWEDANSEWRLAFDILVERNFGTGQEANRDVRVADGGEATSNGIPEFGGYQLVLDLGRPGRDVVQTVVTH